MIRRGLLVLFTLLFAVDGYGETFKTIRQQFEIYQRFTGEIEILSTDDTKEIDNVLRRTDLKRLIVRKALVMAQPEKMSEKDLPSPLFTENYTAPFSYYITVERAFAYRTLEQNNPDDAMQSIRYVFRLTDFLAESGSLELRVLAARTRLQTLETVQALLQNPHCRHEDHETLYKIFDGKIKNRADEETIWTRYREEGERFFEDIPRRDLSEILSPNLLKELEDRRAFAHYEKEWERRFTHDRSVFDRVSEAIVESSSQPYFKRLPVLRQLDREVREHRGSAIEPVFALLLLQEVTSSMRLFAQEQSGIEMAHLALSVSLGAQNRRKLINPLTGRDYEIRLIPDGVMSTYEGNVKPFYVPYR